MIGIAILGAGFMGQTHAGAWKALGRSRPRRGGRVAHGRARPPRWPRRRARARSSPTCEAAIADPRVDLVDICLPTPLHRTAAEAAFAAGKHVLLEKPMALTREDAEAIVGAADRAGRTLLVGLVLRHWPEYQRLHELAAEGGDRRGPLGRRRCACRRRPTGPTGSSTRRSRAASPST